MMFFYRSDSEPLQLGLDTSQGVSLVLGLVATFGLSSAGATGTVRCRLSVLDALKPAGVFRAAQHERKSRGVAGRYQDTMAFTILGPNRFMGSGHPGGREKLPPFVGLVESRDAGRSWQPISLLGMQIKADQLCVDTEGAVSVSRDAGRDRRAVG